MDEHFGSQALLAAVDEAFLEFDERETTILRSRVFADVPTKLGVLATDFGVSRERVRQVEARLIEGLRETAQSLGLDALIQSVEIGDGGFRPAAEILLDAPVLKRIISPVNQPLWRIVERLDNSFEVRAGWWCRPTAKDAVGRTLSDLNELAAGSRAVRLDKVSYLTGRGWAELWVAFCGLKVHEGYALLGGSGIPDRAAVVLEIEGVPMTTEAIVGRLGSDRSVRSARNVLAMDDRFARVDRSSWALRSWGLNEYQSIRLLIDEQIRVNDGSIRLSKLQSTLTGRFSVTNSSVVAYASSPPFRTIDGMVEFAGEVAVIPRKSPFETRRLFRMNRGWALRITLSKDHVRGSGSLMPSALITALGLTHGVAVSLTTRKGTQRVGWNSAQLALGSIKRFVDDDGLRLGDTCFAIFGDDQSFDLVQVSIPDQIGRSRALALAGLTTGSEQAGLPELLGAIGLPIDASANRLAETLRDRGDYDIADCVVSEGW